MGTPKARVDQVKKVNFEKNHFKVLCYFCCLLSLVIKITVIFEGQLFLTPKYVYLKRIFVLELFFFIFYYTSWPIVKLVNFFSFFFFGPH